MTEAVTEAVTADFEENVATPEEEMAALKERAKLLGLKVSPKIGLDALRNKVNDEISGKNDKPEKLDTEGMTKQQKKVAIREKMMREQMVQVRLRIANLNPDKADLHGEVFTVANKYLGNVRKYVPYGEATDEGYHVPVFIFEQLKSRKFLQKKTKENPRTGNVAVNTRWVSEFALEVLPPLTPEELKQLANQQMAAAGLAT